MNLSMLSLIEAARPGTSDGVSGGTANSEGASPDGLFALLLASLAAQPATPPQAVSTDTPVEVATETVEDPVSGTTENATADSAWLPEDLVAAASTLLPESKVIVALQQPPSTTSETQESLTMEAVTANASQQPATDGSVEIVATPAEPGEPGKVASLLVKPESADSDTLPTPSNKPAGTEPLESTVTLAPEADGEALAPTLSNVESKPVSIPAVEPGRPTPTVIGLAESEAPPPVVKAVTIDSKPKANATQQPAPTVAAPKVDVLERPVPLDAVSLTTPASDSADEALVVEQVSEAAPLLAKAVPKGKAEAALEGATPVPPADTATADPEVEVVEAAPEQPAVSRVEKRELPEATAKDANASTVSELPLERLQRASFTTRAFAQAAMASLEPASRPKPAETDTPDRSPVQGIEALVRSDASPGVTKGAAAMDMPRTSATLLPNPVEVPIADVGRVAMHGVRQLLQEGEQRMSLKIIPDSLGEVHIEVTRNGAEVNVRMNATTQAVRDLLDGQSHSLREALVREGFDAPRIQVTHQPATASGGHSAWNNTPGHEAQQQSGQSPWQSARQGSNQQRHEPPGSLPQRTAAHQSGSGALNVTV